MNLNSITNPLTKAKLCKYLQAASGNQSMFPPDNIPKNGIPIAQFAGVDLAEADLSNLNLHMANFKGADLRYANLSGADITYADFTDANLQHANLCSTVATGATFNGADLTGSRFTRASIMQASFKNANLTGVPTADFNWKHAKYIPAVYRNNAEILRFGDFTPRNSLAMKSVLGPHWIDLASEVIARCILSEYPSYYDFNVENQLTVCILCLFKFGGVDEFIDNLFKVGALSYTEESRTYLDSYLFPENEDFVVDLTHDFWAKLLRRTNQRLQMS